MCVNTTQNIWEMVFSAINSFGVFIALIALILSYRQYNQNYKINCNQIKVSFYQKVFEKYILEDLPRMRREIRIHSTSKKLIPTYKNASKTLVNLFNEVKFVAYINSSSYNDLKEKIMNVDDFLVKNGAKVFMDSEIKDFNTALDKKIKDLYQAILKLMQSID